MRVCVSQSFSLSRPDFMHSQPGKGCTSLRVVSWGEVFLFTCWLHSSKMEYQAWPRPRHNPVPGFPIPISLHKFRVRSKQLNRLFRNGSTAWVWLESWDASCLVMDRNHSSLAGATTARRASGFTGPVLEEAMLEGFMHAIRQYRVLFRLNGHAIIMWDSYFLCRLHYHSRFVFVHMSDNR